MDKLVKQIADLRVKVAVTKDGRNKFGGYSYYQIDDIYKAAKPAMAELGIVTNLKMDHVEGYLFKFTLVVSNGAAELEYSVYNEYSAMKGMAVSQAFGSMLTYATKYLWFQLIMADDTPDADATNDHGKTAPKASIKPETASKTTGDTMDRASLRKALEGFSQDELKAQGINNLKIATMPKLLAAHKVLVV